MLSVKSFTQMALSSKLVGRMSLFSWFTVKTLHLTS